MFPSLTAVCPLTLGRAFPAVAYPKDKRAGKLTGETFPKVYGGADNTAPPTSAPKTLRGRDGEWWD